MTELEILEVEVNELRVQLDELSGVVNELDKFTAVGGELFRYIVKIADEVGQLKGEPILRGDGVLTDLF